ncbi:MAG: SurA N-terminal domain-containing protein [Pseudomonadota bacterium]
MLRHLRSKQKWFMWIVLGPIIVVFVIWGIGSIREKRADFAADVNGEVITRIEFKQAYDNAIRRYRQMYGDALSDEMLAKMNVEKTVFDQLITQVLLREGAANLGIEVDDQEVQDFIRNMNVFHESGKFSQKRYEDLLRNNSLVPAAFEESVRKDLLFEKVSNTLGRMAGVADDDIWNTFQYINREIKLAYISFEAESFKDKIKMEESSLKRYFEAHQEDYRVPAKAKVRYLTVLSKDLAHKVAVSQAEIEAYYNANKEEFREPEKRRVSEIFLSVRPGSPAGEVAKVQAKGEEVLKRARAGEDFAGLVKAFSERGSLGAGDLGYLRRGQIDPSVEEAVFSLQKGEAGLARSNMGLHICKVTDVVPSAMKPLSMANAEILNRLTTQKTNDMTQNEAQKTYEQIIQAGGLLRHSGQKSLPSLETDFFSERDEIPGLGYNMTFNRAVLALKKGEVSSLIKLPQGYAIAEVLDRKESFVPPLEDTKERVQGDYVAVEAGRLAESQAGKLLSDLRGGKPFLESVQSYGVSVRESDFFNLTSPSKLEFLSPASWSEISVLTAASPYMQHPVKYKESFYVVKLTESRQINQELYATQKAGIKERLLSFQKNLIIKGWIEGLKKRSKIEVANDFQKFL